MIYLRNLSGWLGTQNWSWLKLKNASSFLPYRFITLLGPQARHNSWLEPKSHQICRALSCCLTPRGERLDPFRLTALTLPYLTLPYLTLLPNIFRLHLHQGVEGSILGSFWSSNGQNIDEASLNSMGFVMFFARGAKD